MAFNGYGVPQIQFDNPLRIYKPGDAVTGWIQIAASGGKVERVAVRFYGEVAVDVGAGQAAPVRSVPNSYNHGQKMQPQVQTTTQHVYFDREHVLFDLDESDEDRRPGYEFDFKFNLPYDLPSSYEGEFGRIR